MSLLDLVYVVCTHSDHVVNVSCWLSALGTSSPGSEEGSTYPRMMPISSIGRTREGVLYHFDRMFTGYDMLRKFVLSAQF